MTVVLRELPPESMVLVRGEPPMPPNTVQGNAIWLGPDEWLVLGGREEDYPDAPVAVDVSANRGCFELAGDGAADVLAQGCALDLHESAFPVGSCAQTLLARTPVILLAPAPNVFRLLVRASFTGHFRAWLEHTIES